MDSDEEDTEENGTPQGGEYEVPHTESEMPIDENETPDNENDDEMREEDGEVDVCGSIEESSSDDARQVINCMICLELPVNAVVTKCGHMFCWPCLYRWLKHKSRTTSICPACRSNLWGKKIWPVFGGNDNPINLRGIAPRPVNITTPRRHTRRARVHRLQHRTEPTRYRSITPRRNSARNYIRNVFFWLSWLNYFK